MSISLSLKGYENLDWLSIERQIDTKGHALIKNMIPYDLCDWLKQHYTQDYLYRSTVKMERYTFGRGEYKYYKYPLPDCIAEIRSNLYPNLATIANCWYEYLNKAERFPDTHAEYIADCHQAGQVRPTPLILKYGTGDYNCLHQDLYGDLAFPLQLAIMLDQPEEDFRGGEFILTEQRPRMQSRVTVVPMKKGDIAVFPVNERPVKGSRGYYRVKMRHGVSELHSGTRHVAGIIFHDAL